MQVISLLSQKGGAGKTTLAIHLAVSAVLSGSEVAIVDLDPQASAAVWADQRESSTPVVISAQASRLGAILADAESAGADLVVIDTAPNADSAVLAAAKASNLVIIPCRPAVLDLRAITSTIDLVQTTGTPMMAILNAVASHPGDANDAERALVGYGVGVCPIRVANRVVFARSLVSGQSAQEYAAGSKAADEVSAVYEFLQGSLTEKVG